MNKKEKQDKCPLIDLSSFRVLLEAEKCTRKLTNIKDIPLRFKKNGRR